MASDTRPTIRSHYGAIVRRAARETVDFGHRKALVVGGVVAVLAVVAASALGATIDIGQSVLAAAIAVIGVAAAAFVVNLVRAPVLLAQEQHDARVTAEAERDRLVRAPVPDDHKRVLRERVNTICRAVKLSQDVVFPSTDHEAIFVAHFPELSRKLASWDSGLRREQEARSALRARLVREAEARAIHEPPYAFDAVVDSLVSLLVEKALNGALGTACHLRWNPMPPHPTAGAVWCLCLGGGQEVLATLAREPSETVGERSKVLTDRVGVLFTDALTWTEASEVANARDARQSLSVTVAGAAELYAQADNIPVSSDCDVCRINLGLPLRS